MTTEQIGVAGFTNEIRQFYDMTLLSRRTPAWIQDTGAISRNIPAAYGKSIDFRRFERPAAATTALTEGTPPSSTNVTVSHVAATISQYGMFVYGSDVLQYQAIDPVVTNLTEALGDQMYDTRDILMRNVLDAGTQVQYASIAVTRGGASGLASGMYLTFAELREARDTLRRQDVPVYDDGNYLAFIHPDAVVDLFSDSTVLNIFNYASNRGNDNPLMTAALGTVYGFKFLESSNCAIFSSAGRSGADVYATMFTGKEAYATIGLDTLSARTIFHAAGSSGIADPLDQAWTLGWKMAWAGVILDAPRVLRLEHVTSRSNAA